MSIEQNLERIAAEAEKTNALLTALLSKFDHINAAVQSETPAAPAQPAAPTAPQAPAAPAATTPPAPPVAEQPAATPPAPTAPTMTPEELNNALVVEFQRLGGREAIDAAIRELGAVTITDLPAEQYQPLLAKVQAIPA